MGARPSSFFEPSWAELPLGAGALERHFREEGFALVAGTDEAGRGALAGPVVAAAVILPGNFDLAGLDDSKRLTRAARERLYGEIQSQAAAWAVGLAPPPVIDRLNILHAALAAMARACHRLSPRPDLVVVDGNRPLPTTLPQRTLVRGDRRCASIAAASILAKVYRDHLMDLLDAKYPGYGFGRHKGYGAAAHLAALRERGPTPAHRRSFRPLASWLAAGSSLFPE